MILILVVDEDKMIQEFQDFFSMEDFYNEEELEEKVGNFMQDIEKPIIF